MMNKTDWCELKIFYEVEQGLRSGKNKIPKPGKGNRVAARMKAPRNRVS